MEPQRDNPGENDKDPKQHQKEATWAAEDPENLNLTEQQLPNRTRAESDSVLPYYSAPQPVHPQIALSPPNQLEQSMFRRRNLPVYTPLAVNQLYPSRGATGEPNQGFSSGSSFGKEAAVAVGSGIPGAPTRQPNDGLSGGASLEVGASVALGGGMQTVGAGSDPKRTVPKRRYTKRQPKSGTNSSGSSIKSSRVEKSKKTSSDKPATTTEGLSTDTERMIERMTGSLAVALTNLQAAAGVVVEVQAELAGIAAQRAAGGAVAPAIQDTSAAEKEDSADEEEEEEDPAGPSSS